MEETTSPPFCDRKLKQEKLSASALQELFYQLPDDLIHLPYTNLSLWRQASREISASAKKEDLQLFLRALLSFKEIKENKTVIRDLKEYQEMFYIPLEEGALRLRLFIGREKKRILHILSNLDVTVIEKLKREFPTKKIPLFFGKKFFQELYLFKGLKEAMLMPPGPERYNLQGTLFQIAMWDGFTRYGVKAMRDLNEVGTRLLFIEYVRSFFDAGDEASLEQALLFIDLLLSDSRLNQDIINGALLQGIEKAFHIERADLAYLFSTLLEKDKEINIHVLNLKKQINAGEVERAFDYYDAMIPRNEELIELFFGFELANSKRIVEEIGSRCEGLSNGPIRNRCSAKLVRLFLLHGDIESALDLVAELPSGNERDSILHTACGILIAAKKKTELLLFVPLFTQESRKGFVREIGNLIDQDKCKEFINTLNKMTEY
jgi:hypothetical protein